VVRIRLRRIGAKKKPFYRIVVATQQAARNGGFIENIGTYDPMTQPETVTLKPERASHWLGVGAQPSDAVARLLKKANLLDASGKRVSAAPVVDAAVPAETATVSETEEPIVSEQESAEQADTE
jgi:small subunit ribosomal protein S16